MIDDTIMALKSAMLKKNPSKLFCYEFGHGFIRGFAFKSPGGRIY